MPKLSRPRYHVALTTESGIVEHEVEVAPGDQFRAELEAGKRGMPPIQDAPQQHTALWVWCALARTKLYAEDWLTFKTTDLYAWEPVRDNDNAEVAAEVDPTQEATSASASSSPTAGPTSDGTGEPSTGSTPTSTTD